MKIHFTNLLMFLFAVQYGCKNSTEPNNNRNQITTTVSMLTDSLQYSRSSGIAKVTFRIHNSMDSTLVFPSCGNISTRLDVKYGSIWSTGYPGWNSPCLGIYSFVILLAKDSSYINFIRIDSMGAYRIVTIYGYLNAPYQDTLISNEFIVQ